MALRDCQAFIEVRFFWGMLDKVGASQVQQALDADYYQVYECLVVQIRRLIQQWLVGKQQQPSWWEVLVSEFTEGLVDKVGASQVHWALDVDHYQSYERSVVQSQHLIQ